jgi:hypothetical protein
VGLVGHCVGRLSHERLVNEGNREGSIVFYVDRLGVKYLRGDVDDPSKPSEIHGPAWR